MLMFTLLGPCPPIHGNADTILGHFGDGVRGNNIFPSELPCSKTNTGLRGTHGIKIIPPQWKKKTTWEPSRERDGDHLKRFDIWKLLPSLYIEHQPVGWRAALYKSSHDPWIFLWKTLTNLYFVGIICEKVYFCGELIKLSVVFHLDVWLSFD